MPDARRAICLAVEKSAALVYPDRFTNRIFSGAGRTRPTNLDIDSPRRDWSAAERSIPHRLLISHDRALLLSHEQTLWHGQ